jgi:hypothetical protein
LSAGVSGITPTFGGWNINTYAIFLRDIDLLFRVAFRQIDQLHWKTGSATPNQPSKRLVFCLTGRTGTIDHLDQLFSIGNPVQALLSDYQRTPDLFLLVVVGDHAHGR